jgi:hypothetical protein
LPPTPADFPGRREARVIERPEKNSSISARPSLFPYLALFRKRTIQYSVNLNNKKKPLWSIGEDSTHKRAVRAGPSA